MLIRGARRRRQRRGDVVALVGEGGEGALVLAAHPRALPTGPSPLAQRPRWAAPGPSPLEEAARGLVVRRRRRTPAAPRGRLAVAAHEVVEDDRVQPVRPERRADPRPPRRGPRRRSPAVDPPTSRSPRTIRSGPQVLVVTEEAASRPSRTVWTKRASPNRRRSVWASLTLCELISTSPGLPSRSATGQQQVAEEPGAGRHRLVVVATLEALGGAASKAALVIRL